MQVDKKTRVGGLSYVLDLRNVSGEKVFGWHFADWLARRQHFRQSIGKVRPYGFDGSC